MSMITMDNYEEYMMMQADGELQPHEAQALDAFLEDHPQLKAEMAIYNAVRLTPDHTEVYAHKQALLKPEADKKIIALPRFKIYAMAAGVAAILMIGAVVALRDGGNNNANRNEQVARIDAKTGNAPSVIATSPAAKTTTVDTAAALAQQKTQVVNAAIAVKTVNKPGKNIAAGVPQVKAPANSNNDALAATARPHQQLENVPTASLQQLPVTAATPEPLQLAETDGITVFNTQQEREPNWFDKLPIDENKKKNINTVATAVASGCEKISSFKRNSLQKIGFSLRVEKKNLIVSF